MTEDEMAGWHHQLVLTLVTLLGSPVGLVGELPVLL